MADSAVRKIISLVDVGLSEPIGLQTAPNSVCQLHLLLHTHCCHFTLWILVHFKSKFLSSLLKTGQNTFYLALFAASLLSFWTHLFCKEPLLAEEFNKVW